MSDTGDFLFINRDRGSGYCFNFFDMSPTGMPGHLDVTIFKCSYFPIYHMETIVYERDVMRNYFESVSDMVDLVDYNIFRRFSIVDTEDKALSFSIVHYDWKKEYCTQQNIVNFEFPCVENLKINCTSFIRNNIVLIKMYDENPAIDIWIQPVVYPPWEIQRLLHIAYLKTQEKCPLSMLYSDVIHLILSFCVSHDGIQWRDQRDPK